MKYQGQPGPNAICDLSGFKIKWRNLVRQWDSALVDRRFVDRRNPQDFVRGVQDDQSLPYSRPMAPRVFIGPGDVTPDDL